MIPNREDGRELANSNMYSSEDKDESQILKEILVDEKMTPNSKLKSI